MSKKEHPERVHPVIARAAIAKATMRTHVYSEYIIIHFRQTGNLVPGCDARDLLMWYEQNMPSELAAITGISQSAKRRPDHKMKVKPTGGEGTGQESLFNSESDTSTTSLLDTRGTLENQRV